MTGPQTQSPSPTLSQILRPTDIIVVPDTRLIFASTSSALLDAPQVTEVPQGVPAALYPNRPPALSPTVPPGAIINLGKRAESQELGAQGFDNVSTVERYFKGSSVPNQSGGLIGQLIANGEVYLRYHIAQRFLFWTNVPMEAFYGNDSLGSSRGSQGEGEKDHISRTRPYAPEYPTFARGGLDDPEGQIPDMNGEKVILTHGRKPMETIAEEIEELSEEVVENTRLNARSSALLQNAPQQPESRRIPPPQIPAEIAALPDSIQKMWKGVQPRFAANPGTIVPQIQLQPSTPSTVASGNQSIKFSRPDTMFSTSSGGSASTDRSAQERSRMVSGSARAFPVPPARALPRSRPKSHLVHRRMDDTRLMPPKKSALRRHSQFAAPLGRPLSNEEVEQISEATDRPDDAQKRREELSRRSFVRFDLHRLSACSTNSASSVDSGLSDILPPKPPMTVEAFEQQPAQDSDILGKSESDSSIYSGIVQEVQRIDTTAVAITQRSASKLASPSRLSYLLTDESSPESPFSDIFAAKPEQGEHRRQSTKSAMTASTVYMLADESPDIRNAPMTQSPPSDSLASGTNHKQLHEDSFAEKKKKRMSHIAV
ncbi:hypothetical protein QFC22_002295 [Naganishia vaughanmartiniae]|uniref:Uncharacterized protein n=1 Tax=Naganishia vaughanmartiniae TaxID=1424756 RepID=A0ACC2XC97_9TREE|nr:hypothetical protein QFC22_002295 [Naganishia vaughanmartiniae]